MGDWLTDKGGIIQSDMPNKVITLTNQLFYDNDTIYLIPRGTLTDNYTIPFGINKGRWDTRPSHLHDIGCKYHKVIVVDLPLNYIINNYIYKIKDKNRCKDIPIECLKIIPITFNECNNLLYKAMDSIITIPKYICKLYRLGVNFNINWLHTGKDNIDINNIYNILSTV